MAEVGGGRHTPFLILGRDASCPVDQSIKIIKKINNMIVQVGSLGYVLVESEPLDVHSLVVSAYIEIFHLVSGSAGTSPQSETVLRADCLRNQVGWFPQRWESVLHQDQVRHVSSSTQLVSAGFEESGARAIWTLVPS